METSRYFFALWPNPVVCQQLAQLQASFPQGRLTHPSDFHLTLAFLGTLAKHQVQAAVDILHALPRASFELQLNTVASFERIGLTWAGPTIVPPDLQQLHDLLGQRLTQQGIWWDDQHGFVPHITLARKLLWPRRHLAAPIFWQADRVVLACSQPQLSGAKYRIVASHD